MKDYYQILELTPEATFQNVIQNYNQYIKMFNQLPTLLSIQKEQLKEIKEAFFILGNYHKRRQYDNKREGYIKENITKTSERCFFRPNLDYKYNLVIKDTKSDILNNKKIRDPVSHDTQYFSKVDHFN